MEDKISFKNRTKNRLMSKYGLEMEEEEIPKPTVYKSKVYSSIIQRNFSWRLGRSFKKYFTENANRARILFY